MCRFTYNRFSRDSLPCWDTNVCFDWEEKFLSKKSLTVCPAEANRCLATLSSRSRAPHLDPPRLPPLNQWNSVYLSFMRVGSDSASGETPTTKQVTIVPVRRPLFPADARTFHRRLLRCCHSGRVRCSKSANQNFLQGRKHLHLLSIGLCHCCVLLVLFGWVTM